MVPGHCLVVSNVTTLADVTSTRGADFPALGPASSSDPHETSIAKSPGSNGFGIPRMAE